jgi:hypothetical protein
MSVKNLKERTITYFPYGKEAVAIFLTGRCPDCVFSNFSAAFHLMEERLRSYGKDIVLIFSSKFLEEDIIKKFNDTNSELLLAANEILLIPYSSFRMKSWLQK